MNYQLKIENMAIRAGGTGNILIENGNVVGENGKLIALVGLNGTGKSTLLTCVSGMQKPSKGIIKLNGKSIHALPAQERAKLISIVFTSQDSPDWLDVYTYISWGRSPYSGMWNKLTDMDYSIIDETIKLTGIFPLKDRFLHQLSDGEKQRCRIARALVQDTPLIILDEPTAFLDIRNKNQVMDLLKMVSVNRNKIVLLSTHDISQAKQSADEIWWIDQCQLKVVMPGQFNESYLH